MPDLEKQIAEWRRQMLAAGIKTPVPLEELESHLREDVERQIQLGMSAQEAFDAAVERVGQASALKSEFEKAGGTKEARPRKQLWSGFAMTAGLFVTGVSLGYFGVLPMVLQANESYTRWLGIEASQGQGMHYVSFVCKLLFGFGAAFSLPAGLLTLIRMGVLDYRRLVNLRRYVIVFNLVIGALVTSPEVMTQLLMFIPLQLTYEVSVWLAWRSQLRETK